MSNNDWTIKLRNKLADHQETVSKDLWAGIEQSLASSSDSEKYALSSDSNNHNGKIIALRRWYVAAAAAAILGVGGSYVYLHHSDSDSILASKNIPSRNMSSRNMSSGNMLSQENRSHVLPKVVAALHSGKLSGFSVASSPVEMTDLQSSAQPASIQEMNQVKVERELENVFQSSDNNSLAHAEKGMTSASVSLDRPDGERNLFAARNSEATSGWTMKLYAENLKPDGLDSFSSSGDVASNFGSGTLADPMPGVVTNPSDGENDVNYLLASYKAVRSVNQAEAKHHAPVSVGIQVAFGVAPRLSVSTGIVYTRTSSDFKPYYSNDYDIKQVLHYVGVPVGINYEFWRSKGFHTYVMAGAEVDLNVKNGTEDNGEKLEHVKRDRPQFSGKASLGAQYDITQKVGLYIEPGAKYYFDNGSDIQNTFKDKKLNFNLQFGLRFNL